MEGQDYYFIDNDDEVVLSEEEEEEEEEEEGMMMNMMMMMEKKKKEKEEKEKKEKEEKEKRKEENNDDDDYNDAALDEKSGSVYSAGKGIHRYALVEILWMLEYIFVHCGLNLHLKWDEETYCITIQEEFWEGEKEKVLGNFRMAKHPGGYINLRTARTILSFHCLWWVWKNKQLPQFGTQMMHMCGNPSCLSCCRPGTPEENEEMKLCTWLVPSRDQVMLLCKHDPLCIPPLSKIINKHIHIMRRKDDDDEEGEKEKEKEKEKEEKKVSKQEARALVVQHIVMDRTGGEKDVPSTDHLQLCDYCFVCGDKIGYPAVVTNHMKNHRFADVIDSGWFNDKQHWKWREMYDIWEDCMKLKSLAPLEKVRKQWLIDDKKRKAMQGRQNQQNYRKRKQQQLQQQQSVASSSSSSTNQQQQNKKSKQL